MKEGLVFVAESTVAIINAMAFVVIVIGTVEMFWRCLRSLFSPAVGGRELRDAYLQYARWLIAGLSLQLAADIVETGVAPSWTDIGRLAAIAVIRTFLNFFLERDVAEMRDRGSG